MVEKENLEDDIFTKEGFNHSGEKWQPLDKRSLFPPKFGQLPNVLKTNGEDESICLHC